MPDRLLATRLTRLALNGTRHVNAVSRIHGIVSARLCSDQWPEVRSEDNPMGFVTNGVHVPTFLHQMRTSVKVPTSLPD